MILMLLAYIVDLINKESNVEVMYVNDIIIKPYSLLELLIEIVVLIVWLLV